MCRYAFAPFVSLVDRAFVTNESIEPASTGIYRQTDSGSLGPLQPSARSAAGVQRFSLGTITPTDPQPPSLEIFAFPQLRYNLLAINVGELVAMRLEKSDTQGFLS